MIIKTVSRIPLLATDEPSELAIIPAKTVILFPGELVSIQVGRPSNVALVEDKAGTNNLIGVTFSPRGGIGERDIDLCQIGTAARIVALKEGPGDSRVVSLEGVRRIALHGIVRESPYLLAGVGYIEESDKRTKNTDKLCREIIGIIEQITRFDQTYSDELAYVIGLNAEHPGQFADKVAATFHFPIDSKQVILETVRVDQRLRKVQDFLQAELERVTISREIRINIEERNEDERRRFFLQQQLYEIKRQLGDEFVEDQISHQIKSRINKKQKSLPPEAREQAIVEAERLGHLSSASAEFAATKLYLDWLLDIPWSECTEEKTDIQNTEKIINRDYYGSPQVKKQIFERLAVRQLSGGSSQGPVLCLAGAPGTGKASLTRAIAKALGKKFVRISVGGMVDIPDIKGTARTYLGASPGMIIRTIKETGVCDPVVLIEDIEYFAEDVNSALPLALLEAIDPRLNARFLDSYIGVPIDLSRAMFICSVKSVDDVPEMFSHRFEVVELPGYIENEKLEIARKHIIPKMLKKHGLVKTDVSFSNEGLERIIRNYTLEAGLLSFTRQIERICRHVAREKNRNTKKTWNVNARTLETYLGTPQYIPEMPDSAPEIGVGVGLAWTGMGGDLMIIEGLRVKGSGEVTSTGSLGEVMKESIQAAHSYVRSKADVLGIDHNDFSEFDIHIHFPSGAIPKDGPSAGVTVSLVIASLMAERPIRNDIAMTGEVTLRGKVLPVGGVKEKVSAAFRAGIRKVFLPRENAKDLKNLPDAIIKKTRFFYLDTVDELFEQALMDFVPSSYTLEKIFAQEIEKAKKRKKTKPTKRIAAKSRRKK
ncbi:MAG: endopeptidase La [candidate division Zixibacteria bacterium]|nr:endopeptidase La [candidate division Zixibacteria bacterium]